MMTPDWLLDIFAAIMLVVAAVSAVRLAAAVARRSWRDGSDVDLAHLLMGIAMAGMLASGLHTLPDGVWEAVFAVSTAWFGWRVFRDFRASGSRALARGHCAPHLVHSAAMIYMFAALPAAGMASGAGMAGSGMSGGAPATLAHPTLAFAFVIVLVAYSVWDLDQLSGKRYSFAIAPAGAGVAGAGVPATSAVAVAASAPALSPRGIVLSPAVTIGCRVAMGVTMGLMLVIMI
jgi:hypothetical protein